jgi:hypothetical protein
MAGVHLELGPLAVVAGVLDGERVERELLLDDGEVLVGGLGDVDPENASGLPVELGDVLGPDVSAPAGFVATCRDHSGGA